MRTFGFLVLFLAFLGNAGARSNDGSISKIKTGTKTIPVFGVGIFTYPTQDPHRFVLEASEKMRTLTRLTRSEVCSRICKNPTKMGIVITTIRSQAACPIIEACPKGMQATEFDVHTHPFVSSYFANPIDKIFVGAGVQKINPNMFSHSDLQHPNAYLVGEKVVLFHDGKTMSIVKPPGKFLAADK